MFAARYFTRRYWAERFWPKVGAGDTSATIHVLPPLLCAVPSVATHNLRIPSYPTAACRIPSVPTLTLRG